MASSGTDAFWALSVATAIPAAFASLILERRRQPRMPGTLPFTWGIYVGLNIGFIGMAMLLAGLAILFFSGDPDALDSGMSLIVIGAPFAAAGYFAVRRHRAGLIIATLLSFNVAWWIANAIYIRHRWGELGKATLPRGSTFRQTPPAADIPKVRQSPRPSKNRKRATEYAIKCPVCDEAPISDARTLWFLWGMVLIARYGSRTFVGCESCVRRESLKSLAISSVAGWWCFPWGFGTPLVILQNTWEALRPTSQKAVEDTLRKVGMNPDELRLDAMGFTRAQRRLIDIAAYVLNSAIWADGVIDPREHARALSILQQVSSGRLSSEQAAQRLASVCNWEGRLNQLSFEIRQTLLRIALDVAAADGSLALPEIAMLHDLAQRLGFAPSAVEEMLNDMFESDTNQDNAESRAPSDVAKAGTILGVRHEASLMEVQTAWRQRIMKYHPDRAGGDAERQSDFTRRSQEINWAKDVLTQYATRMAAA